MKTNPSVTVINHGCKLNQFEGESIANSLALSGCRVEKLREGSQPDVVVVNTCTVTGKSDRKSRNTALRAAGALGKNGLLIVTGCYAETDPEELKNIQGVDLVIGNEGKPSIPDIVKSYLSGRTDLVTVRKSPFDYEDPVRPTRSRVFMKVQDGCSMHCSYCKVPMARGPSQSRDYDDILSSLRKLIDNGYRELILTGINLGSYNYSGRKLPGLIKLIIQKSPEDFRIRISSIEPNFFGDEMFEVITHEKIVPHFHLPLQSGSDRILRLMMRPYSVAHYLKIIDVIREIKPHCHLASDVIVGFPTEQPEDFTATLETIRCAGFASVHVFKYSVREGTGASGMKDDVPYCEKVRRSRTVIELADELNFRFRRRYEGTVMDVVFERHGDSYEGITGNYIRVRVAHDGELSRKRLPVRITSVKKRATYGKLVGEPRV